MLYEYRNQASGPDHLAIEYQNSTIPDPANVSEEAFTLSAVSEGVWWRQKKLVSQVNWPSDVPERNLPAGTTRHAAIPNSGLYFLRLFKLQKNYDNDLPYTPTGYATANVNGNQYNSNGYVRGLIEAAGGTSTVNFNDYVGGGHPVPKQEFD